MVCAVGNAVVHAGYAQSLRSSMTAIFNDRIEIGIPTHENTRVLDR